MTKVKIKCVVCKQEIERDIYTANPVCYACKTKRKLAYSRAYKGYLPFKK